MYQVTVLQSKDNHNEFYYNGAIIIKCNRYDYLVRIMVNNECRKFEYYASSLQEACRYINEKRTELQDVFNPAVIMEKHYKRIAVYF